MNADHGRLLLLRNGVLNALDIIGALIGWGLMFAGLITAVITLNSASRLRQSATTLALLVFGTGLGFVPGFRPIRIGLGILGVVVAALAFWAAIFLARHSDIHPDYWFR